MKLEECKKNREPSSIEILCKKLGLKYSRIQPPNGTAVIFFTKNIQKNKGE